MAALVFATVGRFASEVSESIQGVSLGIGLVKRGRDLRS